MASAGEENQWIFTEEELLLTPSVLDGIPPETEREQRGKGINFITQLGIQLRLPQLTLATASVYLHRFYMRNSLKHFHYYETAATALFLATKVEENIRKFGEVVAACVRAAQKNLTMDVHRDDKEFWRWKDCILNKEEQLLEAICFDLSVGEVPYNLLIDFSHQLGVQTRPLIRSAWAFLNDANHTMLCLLYPARTIAAAALYCAAKHVGAEFPDQNGMPWWEVLGVKMKDIKRACNYIAMVYEQNPLKNANDDRAKYVTTPENGPETTKTRARAYSNASPRSDKRGHPDSASGGSLEEGEATEAIASVKRIKLEDYSRSATPVVKQENTPARSAPIPAVVKEEPRNGTASLPPKPELPSAMDTADGDLEEGEVA